MSLKPTTFSRRIFLGGLGATIALAATHSSAQPFLHLQPLEVAALVDGPDGVAALICVTRTAAVDLRTVLASSTVVRKEVNGLTPKRCVVAVLGASVRSCDIARQPSALLVLGRWEISGEKLLPLVFAGKEVYIDDPVLAKRLANAIRLESSPKRSSVGLTSILDPAVGHAVQRLQSSVMGEITRLAVSTRSGDLIGPLEAAAALRQLTESHVAIKPRRIQTRNLRPAIHITCARGQLVVPLYTKEERLQALPFRLQHFVTVARGKAEPAIALKDMASLPDWA